VSAQKEEKRAPYFTAYVDTEVEVSPRELERAGWVYVGTPSDGAPLPVTEVQRAVVPVIEEFHDDEHDGPMRWCRHAVCKAVNEESWRDASEDW
jgi:hypothetical protein